MPTPMHQPRAVVLGEAPGGNFFSDLADDLHKIHSDVFERVGKTYGEVLREMYRADVQVLNSINRGELVADEPGRIDIAFKFLFKTALQRRNSIIVRGFPRTMTQAEYLMQEMSSRGYKIVFACVDNTEWVNQQALEKHEDGTKSHDHKVLQDKLNQFCKHTLPAYRRLTDARGVVSARVFSLVDPLQDVADWIALMCKLPLIELPPKMPSVTTAR